MDQTRRLLRSPCLKGTHKAMLQDVRFGIRTLLKNWGFTLVAMLSLAIGI
jgi:hypothetical protein